MSDSPERFASSAIRDLLEQARQPGVVSLAGGLPADELLPVERLGVAWADVLDTHGARAFQYGPSCGEPALLQALARTEGLDPERSVITAGSQQALDLVTSVLEHPTGTGHVAAVEHPGYVGAIQVLRARRYDLLPIPVDSEGMDVDVLANELSRGARPALCYVNPSFQNPTGASLTAERGRELIRLAEHYGFVVISDDPYAELSLDQPRPFPLPQSDRLVRLGSMSKTLSPGLRIGWMTTDSPSIRATVVLAKQAADLHASTTSQLITAAVLDDDRWWSAHCEGLRTAYRARRTALQSAVATHLPNANVSPQGGGFFLWLSLQAGADSAEIAAKGLANGVAIVPGFAFSVDEANPPAAIRLSYSSAPIASFDEAVQRLATVIH